MQENVCAKELGRFRNLQVVGYRCNVICIGGRVKMRLRP